MKRALPTEEIPSFLVLRPAEGNLAPENPLDPVKTRAKRESHADRGTPRALSLPFCGHFAIVLLYPTKKWTNFRQKAEIRSTFYSLITFCVRQAHFCQSYSRFAVVYNDSRVPARSKDLPHLNCKQPISYT